MMQKIGCNVRTVQLADKTVSAKWMVMEVKIEYESIHAREMDK